VTLCNLEASGAIAKIVLAEIEGLENLEKSLPMEVKDLGESWLVTGCPFDNVDMNTRFNIFYMYISKETCEILDVGIFARHALSRDEDASVRKEMTDAQFNAAFGMPVTFKPTGSTLHLYQAFQGGIINSAANAIKFANVIIRANAPESPVPGLPLLAGEVDGVWHVHAASPLKGAGPLREDVLVFNRGNAKILAFNP
jgi:hypothetical protein